MVAILEIKHARHPVSEGGGPFEILTLMDA